MMILTREQHEMVRLLCFNPDTLGDDDLEIVDRLIRLRREKGDEAFQRETAAMFNAPQPTLHAVMRELREIKAMIKETDPSP